MQGAFRHGARTPIHALPNAAIEDSLWNCSQSVTGSAGKQGESTLEKTRRAETYGNCGVGQVCATAVSPHYLLFAVQLTVLGEKQLRYVRPSVAMSQQRSDGVQDWGVFPPPLY